MYFWRQQNWNAGRREAFGASYSIPRLRRRTDLKAKIGRIYKTHRDYVVVCSRDKRNSRIKTDSAPDARAYARLHKFVWMRACVCMSSVLDNANIQPLFVEVPVRHQVRHQRGSY